MAVWGKTSDVYTLPLVRLTSADAPWLADAAVVSWSVERELVGQTLPGNIRARSGLSIGDASAVVAVDGDALTPWSRTAERRVTGGSSARLFIEADDGDEYDLGAWLIAPTSGSLNARETQVDLTEAQYVGRNVTQALPPRSAETSNTADPVWIIARLLEQVGYTSAPPPVVGETMFAVSLDGSWEGAPLSTGVTYSHSSGEVGSWEVVPGDVIVGTSGVAIGGPGTFGGQLVYGPTVSEQFKAGSSVYLTLNAAGVVRAMDLTQKWEVVIDADAEVLSVRNNDTGSLVSVPYVGGLSADWPTRVQVEIKRDWSAGSWTTFYGRIRSAPNAAWSAWATQSTAKAETVSVESIYFMAGRQYVSGLPTTAPPGNFAAVQITRGGPSIDLWKAPTTRLRPFGGGIVVPWTSPTEDVWTAIQNVAAANLGAVHLDRDGHPSSLNRDDLAGANVPGEITDIGAEWTDLPWTLDPADTADRLEVTYYAPSIATAPTSPSTTPAPEFWRAEEIIKVPPGGQVITVNVEVDRVAEGLFQTFWPASDTSVPEAVSYNNTISAFDNPSGTGTPLAASVIDAVVVPRSPTRVEVRLRNSGSVSAYLVDANGQPCLILRTRRLATFETPQIAEQGAAAGDARNPIAIDLGRYVQTVNDAEDIAGYLWARISTAGLWRASSVRCRLDWSHDIGKVLRLIHSRTGLEAKALITKVAYDGLSGEIAQTLDLVLLPWTWTDFDDTYAVNTWTTWDAIWAGRTWDDFDADPLNLGD